ncbi:MAG: radical SAM protein [bacterium]|nr:MAG: radical SAM protein [bacterium]
MLKINEIFYSIQGESTYAGLPCLFIRLTGCNLRCRYCDTQYAYAEGKDTDLNEILNRVNQYNCNLIEITGGEPLLQSETFQLAKSLIEQGKKVLVETNGTQNIDLLPEPVIRIMDVKCPGSGESNRMDWNNIDRLRANDNVKFVISHREDFDWAVNTVERFNLLKSAIVLFSPAFGLMKSEILAEWMLKLSLPIRLNLQLHKYIWDPKRRGV